MFLGHTSFPAFCYYNNCVTLTLYVQRIAKKAHLHPLKSFRSPALIGCFVVDRLYFEEIGLLDEGMEVYGGENVELGIRVSNDVTPLAMGHCSSR